MSALRPGLLGPLLGPRLGPRLRALRLNCFLTRRITFWLIPNCLPISAWLRSGRSTSASATWVSKRTRTHSMRALKFIGSIFVGSICISFFFGVGETDSCLQIHGESRPPTVLPMGLQRFFTDAAPTEPRTPGACIHRDKSRFWLQTVKLTNPARSAGGFREALTQNLPLLP